MRTRSLFLVLGLCLAGFGFALYHASDASGTNDGNLWLLVSLILGFALIAASLSVIAALIRSRPQSAPAGTPGTRTNAAPDAANERVVALSRGSRPLVKH